MSTRIKVCGITQPSDAFAAIDLGAEAVGFIFYEGSSRATTVEVAREVSLHAPPFVSTVGVFVNAEIETIHRIVREAHLRAVQLQGDEGEDVLKALPYPVIKAFRPRPGFNEAAFRSASSGTILIDGYAHGQYGGTGKLADWDSARRAKQYGRVILSGGLTPENVADAVVTVRPYAVDVCSGVESAPGRKDRDKVARFIAAVRNVDSET